MRDIAKAAYEGLEPGRSGFMRPDAGLDALEQFQSVHYAAQAMQKDGLILIQKIHRESSSVRQLIDNIQFTRLK
jgi:cytochrome b involved in lipid metabolism